MSEQLTIQEPGGYTPEVAQQELPEASPIVQSQMHNLLENARLLKNIHAVANRYANSTMVPETYQKSPDNCFVAVELAARMGVSPTLVMQNLYIVKGKPSWSGQACISLINGCGKFEGELKFNFSGAEGTDDWGCHASAIRRSDGELLEGTKITNKMIKQEGWGKNTKWQSMPRQMIMYRAAAFFARVYCPEVLQGFSVANEAEDIPANRGAEKAHDLTQDINKALEGGRRKLGG